MDETEDIRRALVGSINESAKKPDFLENLQDCYGEANVWSTDELRDAYEVIGFAAPFCVVRERATGVKGSVEFSHNPRFYFNFVAD